MNFRSFPAAALALAVSVSAAALDPLEKADAYTLEMNAELQPSKDYFPLGCLGDRQFEILPFLGLGMTENIYTPSDYIRGHEFSMKPSGNAKGTYFFNLWCAHSIAVTSDSKTLEPPRTDTSDLIIALNI